MGLERGILWVRGNVNVRRRELLDLQNCLPTAVVRKTSFAPLPFQQRLRGLGSGCWMGCVTVWVRGVAVV